MLYDDEYEYKSLSSEALPHVQLSHSCVCLYVKLRNRIPIKESNVLLFCFLPSSKSESFEKS